MQPMQPQRHKEHEGIPAEVEAIAQRVIGAAIEVHRALGPNHLEVVYENALVHELELQDIPYQRQMTYQVCYKGKEVGTGRVDLVVARCLVVELKAVTAIHEVFLTQTLSYLRSLELRLGLIINFNVPVLKRGVRRVVL